MKNIYLFLIFIFLSMQLGYSQKVLYEEQGESFTLSSYLIPYNSYKYTATQNIKLTDGENSSFKYSPMPGQSFQAEINPFQVLPPEAGEVGGPNPNDDGVVGTTEGTFMVSNAGQATYTIPLKFPGGVAGMTPDLSLVYSSSGKDGILGPGWSLSGLSVISQVPANRYYDGIYDAAKGGDYKSEAYMLDGQRLIAESKTGTGDETVIFKKEQDDFSKIMRKTLNSFTKDVNVFRFEIKTAGGLTYYYGETADSRQTVQIENDVVICLTYYVNEIVDNFGNSIVFVYENNTATGEVYLDNIAYTETNAQEATYKIQFHYTDRNFPYTTYYNYQPSNITTQSIAITSNKIIDYIECEHIDEAVIVKKYDLTYTLRGAGTDNAQRLEHLTSIQEFGLTNETGEQAKYNKTVFEWEDEMAYQIFSSRTHLYSATVSNALGDFYSFIDLNNDGSKELFYTEKVSWHNNIYVSICKYIDYYPNVYMIDGFISIPFPDDVYNNSISCSSNFGDYNGDGKNEMVLTIQWYNGTDVKTMIYLASYSGNWVTEKTVIFESIGQYNVYSADFNGDGLSDILIQKPGVEDGLTWLLGDSENPLTGNVDGSLIYNPQIKSEDMFQIADFNGDGRADILVDDELYQLKPQSSNNEIEKYPHDFSIPDGAKLCNLNHDLKIDAIELNLLSDTIDCDDPQFDVEVIFYNGTGIGFEVSNTSTITIDDVVPPETQFENDYCQAEVLYSSVSGISDFTGDGISDFILKSSIKYTYSPDGQERPTIFRFVSHYNLLATSVSGLDVEVYPFDYDVDAYTKYVDLNGDNQAEIVNIIDYKTLKIISPKYNGSSISKITNGLGAETKIEYAFSGDEEVYGFDPDAEYDFPLIPYNATQKLVKKVERSNGQNGYYTSKYYYEDAVVHTEGLGFIGFKKVTTTDVDRQIVYSTHYNIDETYYFSYPHMVEQKTISGQVLQQTINEYGYKDFAGYYPEQKYYFPYQNKSTTHFKKLTGGAAYKCEVTEYLNYDDYGFPETVVQKKGSSETNLPFITTLTHTYEHFTEGNQWVLGRLTHAEAVSSAPDVPNIVRKSAFTYYDGSDEEYLFGMLKDEITEPDIPGKKLTKTYTYDIFGNITTTTYSVEDPNIEDRKNETSYNDNGRFIHELYNAKLHKTIRQYDELLGMLQTETDFDNNLTTTFQYDGFGRLTTTTAPSGNKNVAVLRWVQDGDSKAPEHAVYYTWMQSSGTCSQGIPLILSR